MFTRFDICASVKAGGSVMTPLLCTVTSAPTNSLAVQLVNISVAGLLTMTEPTYVPLDTMHVPEPMIAVSSVVGTPAGVQFAPFVQSP